MTYTTGGSGNGAVTAQISTAAVRLLHEYTGRGPTKARTTVTPELCVILFADGLTKAERNLVAAGNEDLVLNVRKQFQRTMQEDLVGVVEEHTGQRVLAFMSDNSIDPDMGAEVFVLEREPEAA
jgi:uncharacterized protein YbcI